MGVDIPPAQLVERARIAFMEIRNEMKALAPLVAREKGFAITDYRDVIRELKKQQIVGDAILPHYQARLKQIEEIIRREGIVTLPERAARIRLASEAESAADARAQHASAAPDREHRREGEFVLPLRVPTAGAGAGAMQGFDDFTFDAASWTLTAHEARPGHELQFAAMVEKGVSLARALFAFNSVNVEGWALYAEAEMKPYMPLDGQLIGLQHRLMRAARAFLDPGAAAGQIKPEEAVRFLMDEVVLSEPMARQEVERYTFRSPGQATVVLLRLPALDGAQVARGAGARQELRPQALPRLPARPGHAAAGGAHEDGARASSCPGHKGRWPLAERPGGLVPAPPKE